MGVGQVEEFDTVMGEAAVSPAEPRFHPGIFSLSRGFQRTP